MNPSSDTLTSVRPSASSSPRLRPPNRWSTWLVGALFLSFAYAPVQDKTAPWPRHGDYVGTLVCMDCHEDEAAALKAGSHQAILDSAILLGCETCHGPGTSHADDEDNDPALITHPDKLDSASRQRLCSQCHTDQIRYHGGDMAGFLAAGKKCTTCHKIHKKTVPPSQPGTLFQTRVAANQTAEPVGAQKCLTCHPLRDRLLTASAHHTMAAAKDPQGCETCHGNGSLHVETGGLSRLISRPDTAQDQIATCRSCHQQVDAELFHWTDGHNPLLTAGITCTTCHQVHQTQTIKAASIPLTMVQPPDSELVSNETCAKCHEPAFGVLDGTIHESLGRRDIPLSQGCGGCHPGSLNHARQGGHKDLVESLRNSDANTQAKTCAQCHSADSAMHRSRSGAHHKAQVTCLTCHSPAAPKHRVREDASSKCAECHKQVEAEFKLPNHHPVLEGAMGCVDCHDPHSARPRMRNRELRSQSCVKCHKQYRGPFVFAHQASRTDGCVACHSPHGSVNKMLLKQPTSQQNCLQCHSDFPAFHDQTTGAVFTNCMKCHTEVHGSNHSRYLFR